MTSTKLFKLNSVGIGLIDKSKIDWPSAILSTHKAGTKITKVKGGK